MTSEEQARKHIDALLLAAGWHVCDVADANIHAAKGVAIREFPLDTGFGFADYLLYISPERFGVAGVVNLPDSGGLFAFKST